MVVEVLKSGVRKGRGVYCATCDKVGRPVEGFHRIAYVFYGAVVLTSIPEEGLHGLAALLLGSAGIAVGIFKK